MFVVDSSDSVQPDVRRGILDYIVDEWQHQRDEHKGDRVGVVLFGKDAGIEISSTEKQLQSSEIKTLINSDGTDMEAAIRLAVAAFPDDVGGKRLVLFTDGNETHGTVLEEIHNAASLGVTVDVVPIYSQRQSEFWLEKVLVDSEAKISEPYNLTVVVGSTVETKARVSVYENDRLLTSPDSIYDLRKGNTRISFPDIRRDKPGFFQYKVRVEPIEANQDTIEKNNTGSAFVLIKGEPKIMYVLPGGSDEIHAEEVKLDAPLLMALAEEKIKVDVIRADFLPRHPQEYVDYDAIVFSNVGAHELTEAKMKQISALVEAVGIGFVMIGGENSFGAGAYQGTPIEKMLPVDMEIKQRKVVPNGAIAFVVHSCELGNGNWWARQVVQRAIRVLSPRDYCGVLYYDGIGRDQWLFPMTRCSKKPMMLRKLRNFNPADMMSFVRILKLASQGLKNVNAAIKHVVILSDGDPARPLAADVQDLVVNGPATITTICYGAHGGGPPQLMKDLAKEGNGEFHHLTDPKKLPEIMIKETAKVRKSLLFNHPFVPELVQSGSITGAFEDALAGGGQLPTLYGHVVTSPKPLADIHLLSQPKEDDPTRDPVLASWNYGIGKSVAFTSDAGRRWGRDWKDWEGYKRFWAETIRWVSRNRSDAPFRVNRQIIGDRGKVIIDVVDETTGKLDSSMMIKAHVITPDHDNLEVVGRQTSKGRYEFDFPVERAGSYTVALEYGREDGTRRTHTTGLTVPYSAEFRHRDVNEPLLRRVADAGSGKFMRNDSDAEHEFFTRDYEALRNVQDVWQTLLMAAILLFFADIFIRRVAVDYSKGWHWVMARLRSGKRAERKKDTKSESLEALLKKKQEARGRTTGEATTYESQSVASPVEVAGEVRASTPLPGKGETPSASDAEAKEAPEEDGFTSRLLAAKKRALKNDDK